jgi:DNA-binding beta-propeller fold protein YncE
LYIADTGSGKLLSLNPDSGEIVLVADQLAIGLLGGEDLPAPFLPTGVAVDSDGAIYVSADIDNAVYKITK